MTVSPEPEGTAAGQEASPPRRTALRFALFVGLPALFVALLAAGLFIKTRPKAVAGTTAPDFALPLLGGPETLASRDLKGAPAVVVNFWASWCVPCREEAPNLEATWRQYRAQGVRFLGVNVQDSPEDALAFVKEFGISYPSVRDANLDLYGAFGVRGVPETFFLDLRWRFVSFARGVELGSRGPTKILGAISRPVLRSRIEELLRSDRAGG
jgi:cytochrome c biogenesis protein CcmG, thiol:disulfide interchange protein DsbE